MSSLEKPDAQLVITPLSSDVCAALSAFVTKRGSVANWGWSIASTSDFHCLSEITMMANHPSAQANTSYGAIVPAGCALPVLGDSPVWYHAERHVVSVMYDASAIVTSTERPRPVRSRSNSAVVIAP